MAFCSGLSLYMSNEYWAQGSISLPLWSPRNTYNINGQELFDLQIYSDDTRVVKEKKIDNILNINTLKCYICNIDVPNSYMEKHLKSVKHESFVKIANMALERTQNHLKSDLQQARLKLEVKDTYFCDNCTAIVQTVDKDKHALSESHLNCVHNDALMQHLAEIYENPQKATVKNDHRILSVKDLELQQNKLIDTLKITEDVVLEIGKETIGAKRSDVITNAEDNETSCNKDLKTNDQKQIASKDFKIKSENFKKEKYLSNWITPKTNYKKYKSKPNNRFSKEIIDSVIEDQIKKNVTIQSQMKQNVTTPVTKAEKELCTVPSTSQIKEETENVVEGVLHNNTENVICIPQTAKEQSEVKTPSKVKTNSAIENKCHYVESLNDLKSFLDIAKFLYKDSLSVKATSEDTVEIVAPNVERVQLPLANFHGFHVTGKDVVCKICLDINSENGKKHKWTDEHMRKIMLPLKKGHYRQVSESLYHCLLCNSIHQASKISEHLSSAEHSNNLQKYRVYNQLTQKVEQLAIANHLIWTPDTVYCKICKINTEKTNNSVNSHIHSSGHVANQRQLLTGNKIKKMANSIGCYFCVVCQQNIWPGQLISHCTSAMHMKSIDNITEL